VISMIWAALWSRRWQALAVAVLTAFVVAIAIAAPAYIDASEGAMIRNEINHGTLDEVSLSGSFAVQADADNTHFQTQGITDVTAPFLDTYFGTDMDAYLAPPSPDSVIKPIFPHLTFRQDQCTHIVFDSGRCAQATREIMLPADVATARSLKVGDSVALTWAVNDPTNGWTPAGEPVTMSVVGIYHAIDPHERYWGSDAFFTNVVTDRAAMAPVLTTRGTINSIAHPKGELQTVDAYLRTDHVTAGSLGDIRSKIDHMLGIEDSLGPVYHSKIPMLLDRIDHDRSSAVTVIALAVIPLLLLACFVLFLVVAYGLQDRRTEVGMVRLRGVHVGSRWLLAVGEPVIPVLAAIPIGYAAGVGLTAIATTTTVTGSDTVVIGLLSWKFLLYALIAIAAAIVAAHQRTLAARVAELLRNVPTRTRWRTATAEFVVVAIAAAAVVQMHLQDGPLSGVSLLAPGLIIAAIAVLSGRFVPVVASRIGARALGQNGSSPARLGLGVGALQLARRPGAQRVMTVHVFAIGLLALMISAGVFQSQAEKDKVQVQIGAARVLDVAPQNRRALIDAVAAVDPQGKFAMLVTDVPGNVPTDPPLLAVQSDRLATVADWPDQSVSAAQAATALKPGAATEIRMTASRFQIKASAINFDPYANFRLRIQLVPLDGGNPVSYDVGELQKGEATYTSADIDLCKDGCRVSAIGLTTSSPTGLGATVTIESLRTLAPTASDVDLQLSNPDAWQPVHTRAGRQPLLSPTASGLTITAVDNLPDELLGARIGNNATHIPVVSTENLENGTLGSVDDLTMPVTVAKRVAALPRNGDHGALIDLGNLDAVSGADSVAVNPQVWLNEHAPADVAGELRAHGVIVTSEVNTADELEFTKLQGTSVGMRFDELAGVAALLLAIFTLIVMATIDRRARAEELRVLRVQGFAAGAARRAAFVGHGGIVLAATVVGLVAALVSWFLVATKLPLFTTGSALVRLPLIPPWPSFVIPGIIAGIVLAITAAFAAADVSTAMRRIEERGGSL
jgi:putative ABC transport system permease protein